jgi:hypothetical protein
VLSMSKQEDLSIKISTPHQSLAMPEWRISTTGQIHDVRYNFHTS